MHPPYRRRRLITVCIGLSVTVGWACRAAPVFPAGAVVPDSVRSLAGLERVRLDVKDNPLGLTRLGVTREGVAARSRSALGQAGIEVIEDPDLPLLSLLIWTVEEQRVPDAVAFNVLIEVEQPAHLPRVDRTLRVPTFTYCVLGMDRTSHVGDAVMDTVGAVVQRLADSVRRGTRAAERTG